MTIQQIVAKKLKLYARRRVVTLLDGNYDSVFKGKGVELENMRPYVHGDNIKDIDWKATARTNNVHTKLYAPLRDHRILVVVDSSSSMQLPSQSGMNKKDALFGLIVILGMFVNKNRDVLAACVGNPDGTIKIGRFGNSNNHIEKTLRETDLSLQNSLRGTPPDISTMLGMVLSKLKQRTAIFVVTDSTSDNADLKPILNKLGVKHQVFWLHIEPSSPFIKEVPYSAPIVDIETKTEVPTIYATSQLLKQEWDDEIKKVTEARIKVCRATGVAYGEANSTDDLPNEMRKMFLQAKNYAKRH